MSTAELDQTWRRPLELAWESWQHGSFPVGAVVIGPDGSVVAEGRNRLREEAAPMGQLAGSRLAHAEVNAIAQLDVDRVPGYVVLTSLEPCLLCTGAMRLALIDEVRYAAPDPYWAGVDRIPEALNDRAGQRWTRRIGPAGGLAEVLGNLLPALRMLHSGGLDRLRNFMIPEAAIDVAQRIGAVPDTLDELIAQVAATSAVPTTDGGGVD